MQCAFSPRAELDLEEIGDYIARDNPSRAISFIISFIQEIRELCFKITAAPEAFPLRRELGKDIRMVAFRHYLVFYTVSDSVRIERILHGARDIPSIFGE
ncbi:type II toxin-antitoxin system RelE/ParE family toxin [Desulfosarcina ovata]|uniref:Plasmid stabilization protein n=1 Tax=Desulfosarcina ovata subsp. ovata TaxID=2752305 RepID=A0A5K8A3M2_9BACT|nr:type II toxin-antitoxin system RelE/ParE family toxin [Desulfosarcina ovata]BBO87132.1 plasmid stabilization protein [Desulfosarcina ovata subsp. ovata]